MNARSVLRAPDLSLGWRLLAWVIVVLAPLVGLWYGGKALVEREESSLDLIAHRRLLDEMESFLQHLHLDGVIEARLDRVQRRLGLPPVDHGDRFRFQGDPSLLAAANLADRLVAGIRRDLGAEPLFIFAVGPDCAEVAVRTDPRMISSVQTPPKRLVQQWMLLLAGQLDRRAASASSALDDLRRRWGDDAGRLRLAGDVDRFLKQQFGIYGMPFGPEGECRTFFSNRFGGERIILYHRLIAAGRDPASPLLGGFVVAFRESAFSMRRLLRSALKQRQLTDLQRFAFLPPLALRPGFYRGAKGLAYVHPLPDQVMVHRGLRGRSLIQHARLRPGSELSRTPLPMLGVRIPTTDLRHPLRALLPQIKGLAVSIALLSLLVILGGDRWSRDVNWGIRRQLLAAVAIAVGIPLLGLWLIAGTYLSFHRKLEIQRQLLWMSDRLERVESELTGFTSFNQGRFWGASQKLVGLRGASEAETRRALTAFAREFPSTERWYLIREDGKIIRESIGGERIPDTRHDNVYISVLYRLLTSVGGMTPEGITALRKHPDGKTADIIADSMTDSECGNFLIDEHNSMRAKFVGFQGKQLSFMMLSTGGDRPGRPWGILARFDPYRRLIDEFVKTGGSGWELFFPRHESFSTRLALFMTTRDRGTVLVRGVSFPGEAWGRSELLAIARKSVLARRDGTWAVDDGSRSLLSAARRLTGFPIVAVAFAEPGNSFLKGALVPFEAMAFLGLYSCLIIGLIVILLTTGFLAPINDLVVASARVSAGDLEVETTISSGDEFTLLGTEFNRMVRGLRERRRLSRFVSEEVGKNVGASRRLPRSILFSHLREFEDLVESHSPEEVVELLNGYFTAMEEAVRAEQGDIDKFIGDAVMAVFAERPDLAPGSVRACRAALRMNEALTRFNAGREREGQFTVRHGIGIATGEVIAGDIGSEDGRLAMTVIGDVVNLAARLEANSAKAIGSHVLVCGTTAEEVSRHRASDLVIRAMGRLSVKGKTQAIDAAELLSGGDA